MESAQKSPILQVCKAVANGAASSSLNPSCVAACPSGAIYKRGEDGIVLVSQEKCQGWRLCVSGCPYKKVYFNWNSGKAEKCILCYPRMEMGEAPACMHSCVGKIRYLGVVLYDADRIEETASRPESELVEAQREMILDPFDPEVIRDALSSGIDRKIVESAQKSPIYKYVKQWRMALPLHPEWPKWSEDWVIILRSGSVHCNPNPPPAGGRQRRAQPDSASVVVFHRGIYHLHDCVLRSRWKNRAMVASNGRVATVRTSGGFGQRTSRRRCESVSRQGM